MADAWPLLAKYPARQPYPSEDEFFWLNPHVAGYAAPDGAVALNPHSSLPNESKMRVALNEATRHHMMDQGVLHKFPITAGQAEFFKDSAYALPPAQYGEREDGTQKGRGWLGGIPTPDGGVMTEWSADFDIDGNRVHSPLIVPSLTSYEKELAARGVLTRRMEEKARNWAEYRTASGQSPFAANHEGVDAVQNPTQMARHTIVARILSGDNSAAPYTPEQKMAADGVLWGLLLKRHGD